jgi:hypothetical protein
MDKLRPTFLRLLFLQRLPREMTQMRVLLAENKSVFFSQISARTALHSPRHYYISADTTVCPAPASLKSVRRCMVSKDGKRKERLKKTQQQGRQHLLDNTAARWPNFRPNNSKEAQKKLFMAGENWRP